MIIIYMVMSGLLQAEFIEYICRCNCKCKHVDGNVNLSVRNTTQTIPYKQHSEQL